MEALLNGRVVEVSCDNPHTTVLDWLRSQGLTGAKEGCAEGECGACTIVLVRDGRYVPVNSCLLFLPMIAGQEIYTVEGLGMNEAQRAIAEGGGSQCGYCTPGFAMSLFSEQYRPDRTGLCDAHAMGGNLCRCTGYRPIRDAALALGTAPPDDRFSRRLAEPSPAITVFDTDRFHRPATLRECIELLLAGSVPIAGATDLAVEANLKEKRWQSLVSLEAVPELQAFSETDSEVVIGAALPLSEIERRWTNAPPVVREWFPLFASPLIRNRATLGGNLATASPIGDAAPLLLALDAEVRLDSRAVPLRSFFRSYRRTALEAGELIVSIAIPKPYPTRARFYKVAKRRLDDISTVAACFALHLKEDGVVRSARIAYGGVAATPIRLFEAEAVIQGRAWNQDAAEAAQEIVAETLDPLTDHRGSAAYRLAMAQTLLAKFAYEEELATV